MPITREATRKSKFLEEVLGGDLRGNIEEFAGTSMKDVSKKFETNDESQDRCNTIIPRLFSTGCILPHPSIIQPGEDPDTLLLQECLKRVENDTRCVGSSFYAGSMVETYWPKNVEIKEGDIVNSIRKLIPPDDIYDRLLEESETEGLVLIISWKQHLLGRSCRMRLRFDLASTGNESKLEIKAIYENDDEHHTLVSMVTNIEEFLQIVGYMCTKSWYDFVKNNGPITINGTDYGSIRLRGKHTGQIITLYDSIDIVLNHKRTLLNVQRK